MPGPHDEDEIIQQADPANTPVVATTNPVSAAHAGIAVSGADPQPEVDPNAPAQTRVLPPNQVTSQDTTAGDPETLQATDIDLDTDVTDPMLLADETTHEPEPDLEADAAEPAAPAN